MPERAEEAESWTIIQQSPFIDIIWASQRWPTVIFQAFVTPWAFMTLAKVAEYKIHASE